MKNLRSREIEYDFICVKKKKSVCMCMREYIIDVCVSKGLEEYIVN